MVIESEPRKIPDSGHDEPWHVAYVIVAII